MMKRYERKIGKASLPLLLVLAAALLPASGCVKKAKEASVSSVSTRGTQPKQVPDEGQAQLSQLALGVGQRDFGQINQTMAALTGVDPRTSAAKNTFNAVTASLPNTNDLKTIAGPNIVAITRLAAQYCDLAAGSGGAKRSVLFPGIDFTQGASSISSSARDGVIQALLSTFYKEPKPSADDVAVMQQLFDDLKNAGANTTGLMVSLCTAALGSVKAVVAL